MYNDKNDILSIRREIEYKLVSGNDLIRLYEILVLVADEYNTKEIENKRKEYFDAEKYYTPYTPTFSIEISDAEKKNGSDINNLRDFIENRKTPIKSIWFDFSARNTGVSIRMNSTKTYFNNYEIKGVEEWVSVIKGKLDSIIDDMSSLSSVTTFITKHDFISTFSFIGIMYIFLAYTIVHNNIEMIGTNSSWLVVSYTMSLFFLYEKITYYYKSQVEFELNKYYIDSKRKKRNMISKLIGGLITLFTIVQIIDYFT